MALCASHPAPTRRLADARLGLALAAMVGIAAMFLASRFHLSAMLFALLLGMLLKGLADDGRCRPGIQMASTRLLRTGVALLELQITVAEVLKLGWATVVMIVVGIGLTIGLGVIVARGLRLGEHFGLLSGGVSATLAIASVLPKSAESERDAGFVVIAVTGLSPCCCRCAC